MTQTVKVLSRNPDGTVRVAHVRRSACSGDCHSCSGCGAMSETVELTARNPIGAEPGDQVVMESATGPVLAAAAVLYLLPLALFFLGYALGQVFLGRGGLVGILAFGVSMVLCVVYDRLVAGKKETVYTLVGYAQTG